MDAVDINLTQLIRRGRRNDTPPQFCVETGAPRSIIGLKERKLCYKGKEIPRSCLRPSRNLYRFADKTVAAIGRTTLILETPVGTPAIPVEVDVVRPDVPALLGLDVLDSHSLIPDTVMDRLTKRIMFSNDDGSKGYIDLWSVPIRRYGGHAFVRMSGPARVNFTRAHLRSLHRNFSHPSAEKLYQLIKKARPEYATAETMNTLKELTKRCVPCQRVHNAPMRFRVTMGAENVKFNERLMMDIMYLDGQPVLHIVDEGTRFSAAKFLEDLSAKSVWFAFCECWSNVYTGLPHKFLVDQGSSFMGVFVNIASLTGVEVQRTGVEAHSSLGIAERYHHPLRNTYKKLRMDFPNTPQRIILSVAVKAMNDTLGPEGLVPSALVFGEYPEVNTISEPRTERMSLEARAELARAARKEMETQVAKARIKRALQYRVPPATDVVYQPGDLVLVWRENLIQNRIGEWVGPHVVTGYESEHKLVFVRDVKIGAARPFNVAQVKRYHHPEELATNLVQDIGKSLEDYASPKEPEISLAK